MSAPLFPDRVRVEAKQKQRRALASARQGFLSKQRASSAGRRTDTEA
jgi:hypothetical protein